MSRKVNLDLDTDSLKVIDPNEKPLNESESNNLIDPNQVRLDNADALTNNYLNNEAKVEIIESKTDSWIDDNQISLNDSQNKNTDLSVNDFKTKKDLRTKTKAVMITTLFVNMFFVVWLFILTMVPPVSPSVAGVGNISVIYIKYAADSNLLGLTAVGYVNLILFTIPVLILNIFNIKLRSKTKMNYFLTMYNKAARTSFEVFRYLLISTIILLSINLWLPPLGALIENCSYYSFMYYYPSLELTPGWYVVIVIFSLSLSSYVITLITLTLMQTKIFDLSKFKERNELIKKYFEEVKKAKQQKKINKGKKKQILAEEEQLLNNLQEVSEEEKSLISEEEFQARIKANNEIKNKIKELQKQQDELKKHQSVFLKKRREQETNNRHSLKPRKQEITIPDKELEEIFKNIDLD